MVSGAGGNGFNAFSGTPPAYSAFRESSYYEHLRISVSATSLRADAIRADTGAVFDSSTITAPTPNAGAVTGTVTSSAGGAIPGATVTDSTSASSTTTNGSGVYTLSGLPAGSRSLTASATGFTASQPQAVTVNPGQTTQGVNFSLTPAVSGTPQLVQATGANETAASTSLTANFAAPTAAGHLLVLSASLYTGTTSPINSVTDSGGNTWTRIGAFFASGHNSDGEMWYSANAKAATSVVVHTTGSVVTAMAVQEFSGVAANSPLDVSTGTSNTSTVASSGSVTPTASTDLVVGFIAGHGNAEAISVGAGYNAQAQQTSTAAGSTPASVVTAYKVLTSASAQTFTGSFTTAMYWAAGIVSFKTGTSNTSTAASSGSVTPTASTDLVVGFVAGHGNAEAISVGAGYNAQAQQTSTAAGSTPASVITGYKVLTSASAQTFTGSFTTAMYWAAGIVSFKAGP